MATKIITVAAIPPAVSTGSDINKGGAINAAEFDQNLINLRAAVDGKSPLAGPGAAQIFTVATPADTSRTTEASTTIWVKDRLRSAVEGASGGRQTVMYTAAGHPSYMNIIPAFNCEDIDAGLGTGRHPAFIVNGVNKPELFIGTYQGLTLNGNLVSQPGVSPTVNQDFDTFRTQVAANGAGWHLMTNVERAAIALWCWKNGTMPRGNTNYGRSDEKLWETGRRADGQNPGYVTSGGITLTGSGPAGWRHDGTPTGISDLSGNIWEWATGMRLNAGEIQVLANNDAADNTKDVSATSPLWKAIDGSTGALVAPGSANSVKYAGSGNANYTLVRASGSTFEGMTNPGVTPVAATALTVLKQYGLYPIAATGLGGDGFWVDTTLERLPIVGGDWYLGALAGVFALGLGNLRSNVGLSLSARPACVL